MGLVGLMALTARMASADAPTAAEIVKEMTAIYASTSTYADTGETTDGMGWKTHFTTAFERGQHFRLEVRTERKNTTSYVLWSDFHHTLVAMGNDISDAHQLGDTLGTASKLTSGLSAAIPPLLLPGESGAHARGLAELALVDIESVNGHACWHLGHGDLALWIDQTSHLLRKRTETTGRTTTTIVFEPVAGAPIAPHELARPTLEPKLTPADRGRFAEVKAREALVGHRAPSFTADRISGHYPTKLDVLAGHVVVLELMTVPCDPCGAAAEQLNKIDRAHAKEGVRIIAISTEDAATIARFGTDHEVAYTLAQAELGMIRRAYRLDDGLPWTVIIDQSGIVRDVMIGVPPAEIEMALAQLARR